MLPLLWCDCKKMAQDWFLSHFFNLFYFKIFVEIDIALQNWSVSLAQIFFIYFHAWIIPLILTCVNFWYFCCCCWKMNYFLNFQFPLVRNPAFEVEEEKNYEMVFYNPEFLFGFWGWKKILYIIFSYFLELIW